MKYFAYGSNMFSRRLRKRLDSVIVIGTAILRRHRLTFHKRGRDGSGKCNVVPSAHPDDHVHGVLYLIGDPETIHDLDEIERGYERRHVVIEHHASGVEERATCYFAEPDVIDDELIPFGWYRDFVLAGAHEHDLPPGYRKALSAIPTRKDPHHERRSKALAILGE
ncbi:hypothetical protein Pan216_56010 [Planctomycetes bacterium Pan216]|uniref:Gamma-glutamylcyclotransferase AIG2-like domain-containing protein n=1 Tax=Kolteria novifilia TaxID=2527975 RepID=A0A518BCJ7_9BACT|nr:hypothetical protein Pan216_56010 [Planctomycetes bacterium Pan216]